METRQELSNTQLEKKFTQAERKIIAAQQKGNSAMFELAGGISAMNTEELVPYLQAMGYRNAATYLKETYAISQAASYDALSIARYFMTPAGKLSETLNHYTYTQLKYIKQSIKDLGDGLYSLDWLPDKKLDVLEMHEEIAKHFEPELTAREIQEMVKKPKAITKKPEKEVVDTTSEEVTAKAAAPQPENHESVQQEAGNVSRETFISTMEWELNDPAELNDIIKELTTYLKQGKQYIITLQEELRR